MASGRAVWSRRNGDERLPAHTCAQREQSARGRNLREAYRCMQARRLRWNTISPRSLFPGSLTRSPSCAWPASCRCALPL